MNKMGISKTLSVWYRRNFSNPEAVSLFLTLVFGLVFFELFGLFFMPVIVSIILAYLLLRPVKLLNRLKLPEVLSVTVVFLLFIGVIVIFFLILMPLLWHQLSNLTSAMPTLFTTIKGWLGHLIQKYPNVFSASQAQDVLSFLQRHVTHVAQYILSFSLTLIPNVIQLVIYLVLVPLLLFFFLKDADLIIKWFDPYLPRNRTVLSSVLSQMNTKIGAYIRGKVIEVLILGAATYIVFVLLGLRYPFLLSVLVGLSTIVPYIGALLAFIPIVILSLLQWGMGAEFVYVVISYWLIQTVDANIVAPLLFSEALSLHPIVIILSVIIFGGIWGFWGIFFSIPLASLCWTVLQAWPKHLVMPELLTEGASSRNEGDMNQARTDPQDSNSKENENPDT